MTLEGEALSKLRLCSALTLLVVSLCVSSTALGSSKPPARASATTTLTVLGTVNLQRGTTNMIDGFKKANPSIDFRSTFAPGSVATSQLMQTQLAAGNPPDIAFANAGNTLQGLVPFVKAGILADLSKEPWVSKLPKSLKSQASYKGKVYGFPVSSYLTGLIYNKTVFRKAGVGVPRTIDQLLKNCRTIRSKTGATPISAPIGDASGSSTIMIALSTALVDPNFNALKTRKKTTFASNKGWKDVFKALNGMKSAGCFSPGAAGSVVAQGTREVQTGDSATFWYVDVQLGAIRTAGQSQGQDIGFMGVPGRSAKVQRIPGVSLLYTVPSKNNVAAAKSFLRYMAVPANNSGYNKISGGVSAPALVKGKLGAGREAVRKGGVVQAWWPEWPNQNMSAFMGRELQAWYTGQAPSDGSRMLKGLDYMWANPNATTAPN